jgi:diaminopimelate decarboxylase
MGAIPADYGHRDGQLLVGGRTIGALIDEAGDTPLFVYDMGIVRARIDRFRAAFPSEVGLHYAIKANPYRPLLQSIASIVDGLDVASSGEAALAVDAGMAPGHVSFAGPGKRDRELEAAILSGVAINLESEREADRALAIGERLGLTPRLAVRVNPDFELRGSGMKMGGGAKPFGVDAERAAPLARRIAAAGADYRGLHIFAGSQALEAAAIVEAQASALELADRITGEAGLMPPLVNLGGGFGIPYFPGDAPLDVEAVGEALGERLACRSGPTRYAIELGRWLVGEAGVYLTRIVDRKVSHGELFLVTDGGLHHQLAASGNFGTVVRRNYPVAVATRFAAAPEEEATVVGCLCTPLDQLAQKVALPRAEPGDVIAVFMAGAYGATASPQAFLGHPPPLEMLVDPAELPQP